MGKGDELLYFQYLLTTISHLSIGEGGGEIEVVCVSDLTPSNVLYYRAVGLGGVLM